METLVDLTPNTIINTKFAQPFHNASVSKVHMHVYDPKMRKRTEISSSFKIRCGPFDPNSN